MHYCPRTPRSRPLAGVVEVLFHLEGYEPAHRFERIVPDGRIALVIELDGAERFVMDNASLRPLQRCTGSWISGVHKAFITIGELPRSTELCAIRFRPGAALPIVQRPLVELNDRVLPGESVFGDRIMTLREGLIRASGSEAKLDLIESWLLERLDEKLRPHPAVQECVSRLIANPMTSTLAEATSGTSVSRKHLVELFKHHVGPTPKTLHRILRFASIAQHVQTQEPVDWAAISAACGYADQSHLIKDFARFSGYKPREFLSQEHDRQNFFPVEGRDGVDEGSA